MGVPGLWKLLEPCGTPIPVETLEGKILAVDISIWLHQVVKGFHDNKSAALNNAHLLGLFHRLCKLLFYRIKPIFVFDGTAPELKKNTIVRRQEQNSKLNNKVNRLQALLLQSLAKEKFIREALGANVEDLFLTSPQKKLCKLSKDDTNNHRLDRMFMLPPLSETRAEIVSNNGSDKLNSFNDDSFKFEDCNSFTSLDSCNQDCIHRFYTANLHSIDVNSEDFRNLPSKLRHDILIDIKETRKQSSWGRLHELPARSDDFSLFQMKRLLKRRNVQNSIEEVEKEMGGRTLTFAELNNIFYENGVLGNTLVYKNSQKISCDDHTRLLLANSSKKSQEYYEKPIEIKEVAASNIDTILPKTNYLDVDEFANAGREDDLKLAIKLSLENKNNMEEEYILNNKPNEKSEYISLQDKHLKNIMKGPARNYMIEYGSYDNNEFLSSINTNDTYMMNSDAIYDIDRIFEDFTQPCEGSQNLSSKISFQKRPGELIVQNSNKFIAFSESTDSDTDSDLEEVSNGYSSDHNGIKMAQDSSISIQLDKALNGCKENAQNNMNESGLIKEEDLFAEIFNTEPPQNLEILNQIVIKCLKNDSESTNLSSSKTKKTKQHLTTTQNQNKIDSTKLSKPPKLDNVKSVRILEMHQQNFEFHKGKYINNTTNLLSPKNHNSTAEILTESSTQPQTSNYPKSSESKNFGENLFIKAANVSSHKNETEVLKNAALEILIEQNSQMKLLTSATNEDSLCDKLEMNRNRREREGLTITQQMSLDCQYLLRIFGVPYILAPTEAEAQCAFFDMMKLTDGTITDDSDIWLFGGRTVYKNFFSQNKHVMEMKAHMIENLLHCNRQKLIQIACLVGSDYTTGIRGIGVVTALEIIAQFSSLNEKPNLSNDSHKMNIDNTVNSLQNFRNWWENANNKSQSVGLSGSSKSLVLRNKLKNITLPNNFPNIAVVDAYLNPVVDNATDRFTWGEPDIPTILEFTRKTFGWTNNKTNSMLKPVINSFYKKTLQPSIQTYFPSKSPGNCKHLKTTKRTQKAIEMMNGLINPNIGKRINNAEMRNSVKCTKSTEICNISRNRNPVENLKTQPVNASKLNNGLKIAKYKKQKHQSLVRDQTKVNCTSNEYSDHNLKQAKQKKNVYT